MRVLVTDGATNKALAVVRSIAGVATHVGVSSRLPISPAGVSRFADEQYWIPDRSPEVFVDELDRIVRSGRYDYLLPVGGRSFESVSEHRDRLGVPVGRILPSREAMRTATNKTETYELGEHTGIPTPATETPADRSSLEGIGERIGFPAVIKTGTETEPRFVRVVRSPSALATAYDEYVAGHASPPVVQEYLPGQGRGYFGLYVDGELIGGYAHRRIREYPPEGGASACAESEVDDELREYAGRLLSPLSWTGVAMVEFKESAAGVPNLVEINPKLWGSLDLSIASGMNFPRALLELSAGRELSPLPFRPRRVHWPLSGDLTHAWRRPRSAPAVFADLLSPRTCSNLRIDDPLPHVLEAGITLFRRDV